MTKSFDIIAIRSIIVDISKECFHVRQESDSAGVHYVAYLIEGDVDLFEFRSRLKKVNLDKKTLIIFKNEYSILSMIESDGFND